MDSSDFTRIRAPARGGVMGDGWAILTSTAHHRDAHTALVFTMIVGLDGPVTVRHVGGAGAIAAKGSVVLIPRCTRHTSSGGATATFFCDVGRIGAIAPDLAHARAARIGTLGGKRGQWIADAVRSARTSLASPHVLTGLAQELAPKPVNSPSTTSDERVAALLTALIPPDGSSGLLGASSAHATLPNAIRRIASQGSITDAHLRALFVRDVGVQLRTLLRWLRLSMAIKHLLRSDVTTAAHMAGFADLAHFSRTCRGMLGSCPSELMRRLVQ